MDATPKTTNRKCQKPATMGPVCNDEGSPDISDDLTGNGAPAPKQDDDDSESSELGGDEICSDTEKEGSISLTEATAVDGRRAQLLSSTLEAGTLNLPKRDMRLSAVMEMSLEWASDEEVISEGEEGKEGDSIHAGSRKRSSRQKGKFRRPGRLVSQVGKTAVKVVTAPLNLAKRLGTVGEEHEQTETAIDCKSTPKPSENRSPITPTKKAPMQVVASTVKHMANEIVKLPKNVVQGVRKTSSWKSPPQSIAPEAKLSTPTTLSPKTVSKDSSFVIRTSRPPLTGGTSFSNSSHSRSGHSRSGHSRPGLMKHNSWGSSVNGSMDSFYSSSTSFRSPGLLSAASGDGSSFTLDSSSSTGMQRVEGILTESLESLPTLRSMNSMPSLRSMRSLTSMPSLASIGPQDSVSYLHGSGGTFSSLETTDTRQHRIAAVFMRDLQIVSDNYAGTHIDELAPAARTLLTTNVVDKQQKRWGESTLPQGSEGGRGDLSTPYSFAHDTDGFASGMRRSLTGALPDDAAPRAATRRTSFEIHSEQRSTSFSDMSLDTSEHDMPFGRATVPLWSVGQQDHAPTMARRRLSENETLPLLISLTQELLEEPIDPIDLSTPYRGNDKPLRKATRRVSVQDTNPLPTLKEDSDDENPPGLASNNDAPPAMPARGSVLSVTVD